MRYLGVPLCTKKLNLQNCEPLLQQIKQRLSSWSAKALSFAGRLLLIKTLQSLRSNRDSMQLTQLATQASIYWLWSEQNSRLHNRNFKSPEVIVSLIDKQIRNQLQSFRHSRASSVMTQLWFLRT
ncbi:hypothetical protein HID58_024643 [Brassica napus]|uniref:Uncharacterized protein n=1 Tax=Brassica napus TaxID=3708 RepID=A0ABQ8CIX5_BRANA|nr:hypothetical protein HID58_024643 [Brassica napus]